MKIQDLQRIHELSVRHEEAVLRSTRCGCFYCLSIFASVEVAEWVDEPPDSPRGAGKTANCPRCGIDAVLPDGDQVEVTAELLTAMNHRYFIE
jgi:hypothetical protein